MDGGTFMIADGLNILYFSTIAVVLVFLATRTRKKHRNRFKHSSAGHTFVNNRFSERLFEIKRAPARKACPSCAEQLPLSALICDACHYNFLAARPGREQKMLLPPEPMTHDASEQGLASAAL
jgi:hypothetical protein